MTYGLTRTQRDAMRVIQELTVEGVSPSYEEIAAELGLASKGGVVRLVTLLVDRGYLCRRVGHARSLMVLKPVPMAEDGEIVALFDAPWLFPAPIAAIS